MKSCNSRTTKLYQSKWQIPSVRCKFLNIILLFRFAFDLPAIKMEVQSWNKGGLG